MFAAFDSTSRGDLFLMKKLSKNNLMTFGAITQCSVHFKIGKHQVFGPSGPKLQDGIGKTSPRGGVRINSHWPIIITYTH